MPGDGVGYWEDGSVLSVDLAAGTPVCAWSIGRDGHRQGAARRSPLLSRVARRKARRQDAISYSQPAVILIWHDKLVFPEWQQSNQTVTNGLLRAICFHFTENFRSLNKRFPSASSLPTASLFL